jgi:hypothetical protein
MTRGLALVMLAAAPAFADYSPPSIRMLVLGAEAIVEGTITNTIVGPQGGHFILEVASVLAGPVATPEIEVVKFSNWTCAQRWAPYARGQRVLLFLAKGKTAAWHILSAGGEGEMPIVGGKIITHYSELALTKPVKHAVHGGSLYGHEVPAPELFAAVRAARSCFTAKVSSDGWRVESVRLECSGEAKTAADRAPLTAKLFSALAKN